MTIHGALNMEARSVPLSSVHLCGRLAADAVGDHVVGVGALGDRAPPLRVQVAGRRRHLGLLVGEQAQLGGVLVGEGAPAARPERYRLEARLRDRGAPER